MSRSSHIVAAVVLALPTWGLFSESATAEIFMCEVTLTDFDGEPATDAVYRPHFFRVDRSFVIYRPDLTGQPETYSPDADGVVRFSFEAPPSLSILGGAMEIDGNRVGHVSMRPVEGNLTGTIHARRPEPPRAGVCLRAVGLDANVDVTDLRVGDSGPAPFLDDDRICVSIPHAGGVGDESATIGFAISADVDGVRQFSDDLHLPDDSATINLNRKLELEVDNPVLLQAGREIRGQISDNVKRPVIGVALVQAFRFSRVTGSRWYRSAAIHEDGSFTIEDVPFGCHLQIETHVRSGVDEVLLASVRQAEAEGEQVIASATYVSAPVSGQVLGELRERLGVPDENNAISNTASHFVHADEVDEAVVIPMVPAATLALTFRDLAGNAVPDLEVSLRTRRTHIDEPRRASLPNGTHRHPGYANHFRGITDSDGQVTITGLPPGRVSLESLIPLVANPTAIPLPQPSTQLDVTLKAGETQELSLKLKSVLP